MVALVAATISQAFAQETTIKSGPVLTQYYNIKDALVSGNTALAATKAEELKKTLTGLEQNALPETSRNSLLKEASQISASKDIKAQRAAFTAL